MRRASGIAAGMACAGVALGATDAATTCPGALPAAAARIAADGMAPSGDFAFVVSAVGGGQRLDVLRRDGTCDWRSAFAIAVHSAERRESVAHRDPVALAAVPPAVPSPALAPDGPDGAVGEFEQTAQHDGFAAALRTYALDAGFRLYVDGWPPFEGAGVASAFLESHPLAGAFVPSKRVKSRDGSLVFAVGALVGPAHQPARTYVEIWQYDARVANWGLRLLLVGGAPGAAPPS